MRLFTQSIWRKHPLPKLILTDIDGVWTDGGMYYSEDGIELKRFNTSDSAGVLLARKLGIPVGVITGENSQAVTRRAQKLNVEHLFIGVANKLHVATALCNELGISLNEVAYIGDDINDIALLNAVGYSACPSNAPKYIKRRVHLVTKKAGGNGAFRFFVEHIARRAGVEPLNAYMDNSPTL